MSLHGLFKDNITHGLPYHVRPQLRFRLIWLRLHTLMLLFLLLLSVRCVCLRCVSLLIKMNFMFKSGVDACVSAYPHKHDKNLLFAYILSQSAPFSLSCRCCKKKQGIEGKKETSLYWFDSCRVLQFSLVFLTE